MINPKKHWNNIYKTTEHKDVGWYQESPQISSAIFDIINASVRDSVIDIGCGASVLVDNLIFKGFKSITLLDLSEEALLIVKSRLKDKGSVPHYLALDITQPMNLNKKFNIWHDRAVFHFLTNKNDRKSYLNNLENVLLPDGFAIIGTFALDGPDKCSGLDIVQYDEAKMRLELSKNLYISKSIMHTHVKPSGNKQAYIYFIIQNKST